MGSYIHYMCIQIYSELNRCKWFQDEEVVPPDGGMPAKPSEAPGIDKKRNTSVISKKSTGTESAQLSRVGSMHDPIKKQESTVSGMSQDSKGSGKLSLFNFQFWYRGNIHS